MSYLAPILVVTSIVMACFTAPDGNGVWVAPNEVQSVSHANDCAPGAHSKITLSQGSLCVQETPQQVLKILDTSK